VLQRKFDEFQKDMAAQEYRVAEVNEIAEKLILEGHSERETIVKRTSVSNNFSSPFYDDKIITKKWHYRFVW